jgi:uncharacterized protein (TIGR02646 family)
MRRARLGPPPPYLDSEAVRAEREAVETLYADAANAEAPYKFKVYKHQSIKDALNELFFRKCGYCESHYEHVAPMDVEHYRPKSAIRVEGHDTKPGYHWLASSWGNLLPSCNACNRSGKSTHFPLADERRRARKEGQEDRESPLLLDPYQDNPERHLRFDEEGGIRPAGRAAEDPKGRVTIDVCKLARVPLSQERKKRAKEIRAVMRRIEELGSVLEETGSGQVRAMIAGEIAQLKAYREPHQPYSTMARQLTDSFLRRLRRQSPAR